MWLFCVCELCTLTTKPRIPKRSHCSSKEVLLSLGFAPFQRLHVLPCCSPIFPQPRAKGVLLLLYSPAPYSFRAFTLIDVVQGSSSSMSAHSVMRNSAGNICANGSSMSRKAFLQGPILVAREISAPCRWGWEVLVEQNCLCWSAVNFSLPLWPPCGKRGAFPPHCSWCCTQGTCHNTQDQDWQPAVLAYTQHTHACR